MSRSSGRRIAVTGKGGSGKTTLVAVMTGLLSGGRGDGLLVIDADSAVGLPWALGIEPGRTVAGLRRRIIEDPQARASMDETRMADVMASILLPGDGFSLLVMGRPEGPGCYCAVNDLLRHGIDTLSGGFDLTLVDCEAGPEQASRRVVRNLDVLLIVVDTSVRSLRAARSILDVIQADESIRPGRTLLVVNRSDGVGPAAEHAERWGIEVLGHVPEDPAVREHDALGKPLLGLPGRSSCVAAVRGMVESGLLDP